MIRIQFGIGIGRLGGDFKDRTDEQLGLAGRRPGATIGADDLQKERRKSNGSKRVKLFGEFGIAFRDGTAGEHLAFELLHILTSGLQGVRGDVDAHHLDAELV